MRIFSNVMAHQRELFDGGVLMKPNGGKHFIPVGAAIAALISQGLAGLSVNAPSSRYTGLSKKKKKKRLVA